MITFKNDKVGHAAAGLMAAAFGLFMLLVLHAVFDTAGGYLYVPLIAASVAGITKELTDWTNNRQTGTAMHTVDLLDFLATAAPGAALSLAGYLMWGQA